MLLSQTAEYALRAMAALASEQRETPARAQDLSGSTGIPPHYHSKVLRRLVLAGLLDSQKGQGGGFSLSRPPEEIRFEEILIAVDAYPEQGRCAFGWGQCQEVQPCPLHHSWIRLSDAIHHWASTTTLGSVSNAPPSGRPADR
jgi:Rrf2 family iron-sulfur cluster assembly transcriptional regulator